jgi:hypothetical protein
MRPALDTSGRKYLMVLYLPTNRILVFITTKMAESMQTAQNNSQVPTDVAMASQLEPSPVGTLDSATESNELDAETDVANTVYDDDDEDNDDDAKSETSTVCYEHECFETFQHKVAELVASKLNPDSKSIRIERMKGGSYNRVVGAEIHTPKPGRRYFAWAQKYIRTVLRKPAPATSRNYVFRTSRNDGADMEDQIAILKAVGARLRLPIPEVVHYDLSSDNVVGRPFMIQKRIPGRTVTDMLKDLNLEQKKYVTKRITEVVSEIASLHAAPGDISHINITAPADGPVYVNKIPVPRGDSAPATPQKPIDHLLEQCETWREFQTAGGFCFHEIWDSFAAISKALEVRGFLNGPCVLVHGDLREYNLLAEVRSATQVDITGIIDWDEAYFAPQFMAYQSPFWLWISENASSDDLDDETNALLEPESEDDRVLKGVFLDNASADYKKFAFAPEAMLARRMYHILRKGIFGDWSMMEAEAIISEWDAMHPEDGVPAVHDGANYSDEDEGTSMPP